MDGWMDGWLLVGVGQRYWCRIHKPLGDIELDTSTIRKGSKGPPACCISCVHFEAVCPGKNETRHRGLQLQSFPTKFAIFSICDSKL